MLIYPVFQKHSLLKKPVSNRGSSGQRYELYHVRKLHNAFIFARWVTTCRANFVDSCGFRCGPELPQQHRHRGRRNRPRLLTLPQIGGKMKYTPDGYRERCRFDAFCKTVLRNEARTHLRDLGRQRNREIEFSALSQQEMDKLCTVDEYPSDSILFTAYGYALHIHDELVAAAFASLPEQEQGILILHCVLGWQTERSAVLWECPQRRQRHRTKALNELRKRLEEERRKPK